MTIRSIVAKYNNIKSTSRSIDSLSIFTIGTQENPATSGVQIFNAGLPSGDYFIKPTSYSGDAKILYVDNNNQGGGWVLIGKGRETNGNIWWDNGSQNETLLKDSTKMQTAVAHVDSSFVNALWGGQWQAGSLFLVNRQEVGDSWRFSIPSTTFAWTQFGINTQNVSPNTTGNIWRYSSNWWNGTNTHSATGTNISDYMPANDATRTFTWWWSGHGSFRGWSAGSTVTSGFQAGGEGHAIQNVQIYAR